MANDVRIKLTDTQKTQIKEAAGKDVPESTGTSGGNHPAPGVPSPAVKTSAKYAAKFAAKNSAKYAAKYAAKNSAKFSAKNSAKYAAKTAAKFSARNSA